MSKNDLNYYLTEITKLQNESVKMISEGNHNKLVSLIEQMRKLHGGAIIICHQKINEALKNESVNRDKYCVEISGDQSLIHLMHNKIRAVEKMAFRGDSHESLSEKTEIPQISQNPSQKFLSKNKSNLNSAGELEINGLSMTTDNLYNNISEEAKKLIKDVRKLISDSSDKITINKPALRGGNTPELVGLESLTETLAKINTENLKDYLSSDDQQVYDTKEINPDIVSRTKKLDIDKPTLVLYWADWCGFSKQLKPVWDQLVELIEKKNLDLQYIALNVGKRDDLHALATSVGVTGYPTLVLFKDGKIEKEVVGGFNLSRLSNLLNRYGYQIDI